MKTIEQRLSQLSVENLYYIPKVILWLLSPVWLFLLFAIVMGVFRNGGKISGDVFIVFIIYLMVMLLIYSCTYFVERAIYSILTENLDLDKFLGYYLFAGQKNKLVQAELPHAQSLVSFYQGDFEEHLALYEQWRESSAGDKFVNRVSWEYYASLSYLHKGEFTKATNCLERLELLTAKGQGKQRIKTVHIAKLEWIAGVFVNSVQTGQLISGSSKIDTLTSAYYKALNEHNKGNAEQARELFATIASETADLFYVREASKYLEE